ncbi:MAG: YbaB/EbfC family nucleoid-associated protein [Oscillospiraceae bacterium]|nr:YbaB/EbfC family nucleoid-associated protein [Oscillospiraceae bacterium]
MAKGGFRGGYGGMSQANMMKQAQKMQQDFLRAQKELEEKEFTAKSGGGVVTAVVNGNKELIKLTIDPDAVDPDDIEMLEDLVIAAVNEALRMYEAESDATVNKIAGGLNLGGNFGF